MLITTCTSPESLAAGRASLTVDVLKDGWVRVPVPAGLLVREARLDGKPLSLVPSAQGKSGTIFRRCSHMPGGRCWSSMSMYLSRFRPETKAFRFPPPSPA